MAELFTVGHSNHPFDAFAELLKQHRIDVLVDTRSSPYSQYVTHFNREAIQAELPTRGIKYLYLGEELGGRPDGAEFYDEAGHVRYYRVAESAKFLGGIERVEAGIRKFRVALMCSEEDPTVCHRFLLVSRVLAKRGVAVLHIRGDGSVQADADLRDAALFQGSLFDLPGEQPWKSLRSVSPRRTRESSSDP